MKIMNKQLRMERDGSWSHGTAATRWAINPTSLKHGWCVYRETKLIKEVLASMADKRPRKPRHKEARQMVQFDLSAKAQTVTYKTASMGGIMATHTLIAAIQKRIEKGSIKVCPIVRLRSQSYRHSNYGTIYVPDFEIVGWTDLDSGGGKRRRPLLNPSHHATA